MADLVTNSASLVILPQACAQKTSILGELAAKAKKSSRARFLNFGDWVAGLKFSAVNQLSELAMAFHIPFPKQCGEKVFAKS